MQHVIRRARPTHAVVDTAAAPTAAPTRRLRTTSDRLTRLAADRQAILEDLKLISDAEAAIDRSQALIDIAVAKIESRMREHRIGVIDNGEKIASLVETFSRQSRTIDPKKYRAKVTAEDFWKSIDVSVTKAMAILGEKELNVVSDVVPAKSTGTVLKIKELSNKRK